MSFNPEWCKDPDQRCDDCVIAKLQVNNPEAAEQTLAVIAKFDLATVAKAAEDREKYFDSYDLSSMLGQVVESGKSIDETDVVASAVKRIVAQHGTY